MSTPATEPDWAPFAAEICHRLSRTLAVKERSYGQPTTLIAPEDGPEDAPDEEDDEEDDEEWVSSVIDDDDDEEDDDQTADMPADAVILPVLTGRDRRTHAAIFSFMAGVTPPMPMFGRSLL